MRSSTSLLGRILMRIALQARIFGVAKTECVSVDNKFSVISVWLILLLGIVKTELSLCLRCTGISM